MNKKIKVVIVGANGVIGTVLKKNLTDCEVTALGREEVDVRNYSDLISAFANQDVVIHLAHCFDKDCMQKFSADEYCFDNSLMTFNAYKAAVESKVKRVIMASSVHADNFYSFQGPGKLSVERIPTPNSPYGANKIFMESLGKYFAAKGLEVICVRLGGVNAENVQPNEHTEHNVWLSHEDCIEMINSCIHARRVPNNYSVFYAVSNNQNAIHDTSNPFGWNPR